MKPALILAAALTTFSAAVCAHDATDCFPDCQPVAADAASDDVTQPAQAGVSLPCGSVLVQTAESLNDRIKPVKTLVGYVRSPQGLALKLVNDHVVKIPAWVGYAMDPVGSIKHKALEEVRGYAKKAVMASDRCVAPAVTETEAWSIDAA